MSYPADMFSQCHSYELQDGQLVLAEGRYALAAALGDRYVNESHPLLLEGDRVGHIEFVERRYACCYLTSAYGLKAKATGRPRPLEKTTLKPGELVFTGEKLLIVGKLEETTIAVQLDGSRGHFPADKCVVYSGWQLWATGEGGKEIGKEPLLEVQIF